MATTAGSVYDTELGFIEPKLPLREDDVDMTTISEAKRRVKGGDLPPCNSSTEANYDDWCDQVRRQYQAIGINAGQQHFITLIVQQTNGDVQDEGLAAKLAFPNDLDMFFDELARRLFPDDEYFLELYMRMYDLRQVRVQDLPSILKERLTSYYRLSRRRNSSRSIYTDAMKLRVDQIIPEDVSSMVTLTVGKVSLMEYVRLCCKRMANREIPRTPVHNVVVTQDANMKEPTAAVEDDSTGSEDINTGPYQRQPRRTPTQNCHCCGKPGHFRKYCPDKDEKCTNCQRVGHLAIMCNKTEFKQISGAAGP